MRTALITTFFCVLLISTDSNIGHPIGTNIDKQASDQTIYIANKNKQNKELQKKAKEILEPVIVLKNTIEAQLPKKELNTVKRIAFKVFIIARKYL